jgi:hypothetical protein
MNLGSVSNVIAQNLSVFHWPGVVSVRAGYSFIND